MTIRIIIIIIIIFFLMSVPPYHMALGQAGVSQFTASPREATKFTFAASRQNYRAGEKITVQYSIVNVGTKPIYIHRVMNLADYAESGVKVNIYDTANERFKPSWAADSFSFHKKSADVEQIAHQQWLTLSPNEFFGLQTALLEAPMKPGRYKLVAEYFCNTSRFLNNSQREQMKKLPYTLLEGTFTAEPVWIEILPQQAKQK